MTARSSGTLVRRTFLAVAVLVLALLAPVIGSTSASAASCPCSLWTGATTPGTVDSGDGAAIEVGLQFSADSSGYVYGLRFYKSAANTGTHVGSLWTTGGTLLAQVVFSGETAQGWQQAAFAAPVPVAAGTPLVVSYHAPSGHYSFDAGYFAAATDVAPLHVPASSATPNGLFTYSAVPTFPTGSFNGSDYWVDPVFDTAAPASTPTPTVLSTTPANGATAAGPRPSITATFNVPVQPSSIVWTVRGPGGAVPGTSSYDVAAQTATFTPGAPQLPGAVLNATISGATDLYGHLMSGPFGWSFSLTPSSCPCTLWPASTVPTVVDSGDAAAVEVGTAFTADTDGQVSGVRFYKSDANTGVHVGSLWTSTGTLLGQVTFGAESPNGWQEAAFSPAVAVTAGTVYVISYHTNAGHYSFTSGYFAAGYDNAPLHALGGPGTSNGLFTYSAVPVFPTGVFNAANYWVAPVYSPASPLHTVTVTASDVTQVYGTATPPAVTPSYSGFVNGDTPAVLTAPATCTAGIGPATAAGVYPATTGCSGAVAPNYTFVYVKGTATVTRAVLTARAANVSRGYGAANPALTLGAFSGFKNGDTAAVVSGSAALSTTATTGSPVGSYPITAGAGTLTATNYSVSLSPGTLTVTPAAVKITPGSVSLFSQLLVVTFSATVTNAASGAPVAGVPVTFTGSQLFGTFGCTGTTSASGVASCSTLKPLLLFVSPNYSLTTPASTNYLAGTATGTFR